MNSRQLVATFVAATLPFAVITAGDSSKPEAANQRQEQGCENMGMKGTMNKRQIMSNWKDQDAELDRLIADMSSATADKKLDAVAAVLIKLVEERKEMHQQMREMTLTDDKDGMRMCHMMMGMQMEGGQSAEHTHHE